MVLLSELNSIAVLWSVSCDHCVLRTSEGGDVGIGDVAEFTRVPSANRKQSVLLNCNFDDIRYAILMPVGWCDS